MDQASNTLRTVAHEPLARLPTAANPTSTSTKSTLKPEAPVYTPKSGVEKTSKPISDKAIASLFKKREHETPEDAVEWLRAKTITKDREVIRKLLEGQDKTMAAFLAMDSFPDNVGGGIQNFAGLSFLHAAGGYMVVTGKKGRKEELKEIRPWRLSWLGIAFRTTRSRTILLVVVCQSPSAMADTAA